MEMMEIILLIAGGIIFVLSFFIPERKGNGAGNGGALSESELRELVRQELESVRGHVDEVVEEAVTYAMEKTERSLERLSNEKIMAVNEYSDTVLAEIHKNHEEAVFLYDMLNNKHNSLKNTVADVNNAVKEAEKTMASFQKYTAEGDFCREKLQENAVLQLPESGNADGETAQEGKAGELSAGADTGGNPEEETEGQSSNEKILQLYRQGKSVVAIAKELDRGVGEVKLVVDLFRT